MNEVMDFIKGALPKLPTDDLTSIKTCLQDIGVEGLDDMIELKEDDLVPILKPIQARKLITQIKCHASPTVQITNTVNTPTSSASQQCLTPKTPTSSLGSASLPVTPTSSQQNWSRNFKVSWSSVGPSLQQAIETKQHISPADRRRFVSRICDDIAHITRLPGRSALRNLASNIVEKYPDTFMDKLPCSEEMLGNGYQSLLQALENYMNNHYSQGLKGIKRSGSKDGQKQTSQKSRKIDSYGSVNWEPADTEDEELVEENKNWLKVEISKSSSQIDHKIMEEAVRITYPTQRHVINNSQNLASLKQDWPVLFNMRYLAVHFEILMGFEISQLDDQLLSTGQALLQLAKDKLVENKKNSEIPAQKESFPEVWDIISWYETESKKGNTIWAATQSVLPLLLHLLSDQVEDVIKLYAETTSLDEVDLDQQTPYIAIIGESIWQATYHIIAEGTVVISYMASLVDSVKALLMTYYVFKIPYAPDATATLEFIQRCLAKLNPEGGPKVARKKGRSQRVAGSTHPKVTALCKKLQTTIWQA